MANADPALRHNGVKAGPQITEALQLLAGLLYVTSTDPATAEGRMHLQARELLPALLGMSEEEVTAHIEEMHRKHGLSLTLDYGIVARPDSNGDWYLEGPGDSALLTTDSIKLLAEAAGVIV